MRLDSLGIKQTPQVLMLNEEYQWESVFTLGSWNRVWGIRASELPCTFDFYQLTVLIIVCVDVAGHLV